MHFEGIRIEANATVTRGPVSWTYFYVVLGFLLAIESSLIQMSTPLRFPLNLAAFLAMAALTVYVVLFNGRCQNALLKLKLWYENKAR